LEFIVRDEIEKALDSKYIIFVTKGDEVFRIIDLPEIDDSEFENSVGVLTDSDKPLKNSEEAVEFVKNIKTISFNDTGAIANYNKAIADYTKAIELEPNKSRAYYNRGLSKYEFNDYTGAIADYNIAIRLDPNYADAYYNRGLSRYILGDKNGGNRDFLKAQQLGGDGFYIHEQN
jgi:tetratricopeptide (TPR) repeat protein